MQDGSLQSCELFLFTGNLVAEYTYYKGTFYSRILFKFVLRLRKLEMPGEFLLHIIHITGTRRIECGVNTLSRGITSERVILGNNVLY